MTTGEELEQMRREREAYLLALYDLTKDSELRWATHRDIANRAGIDDARIMIVSQNLAQLGFAAIKTMGGPDGYVELTAKGQEEAERLIELDAAPSPGTSVKIDESVSDSAWAERNSPLLRLAYEVFAKEGSWPELDPLQRALDQQGVDIDVRASMHELSRAPGEVRSLTPMSVVIPLRILKFLPEASPALQGCLVLVQRAVELYFSDADSLQITSSDPLIASAVPGDAMRHFGFNGGQRS